MLADYVDEATLIYWVIFSCFNSIYI